VAGHHVDRLRIIVTIRTDPDHGGVATVRAALAATAGQYAMVDERSDTVPTITIHVENATATVRGTDGEPLQNLSSTIEPASLAALSGACIHLARWFGTRDRTPVSSSLNGVVAIELIPAAAGETAIPVERAPMASSAAGVVLNYVGGQPPRAQFRVRNTSATRLYVALLDLTDSFGCSVMFDNWLMPGEALPAFGGRIVPVSIPAWRDASWRVGVNLLKVFASKTDFSAAKLKLDSLLNPKAGGFRDIDEVTEEDSSFWGTTTLRMETRR
jgi:hypothetical protein